MRITRNDTSLEIWHEDYINHPDQRDDADIDRHVIQIEPIPGNAKMFIVEVL